MKHQQHQHQRQRGRGRKPGGGGSGGHGGGGHNSNRSFESNGPDVKVRGSASHVYEKYLQLARDANSSGDRVMAESYLQHAEHYFRIVRATQPAPPPQQFGEQRYEPRFGHDPDYEDIDEGGEDAEAGAERPPVEAGQGEGEQPAPYRQDRGPPPQREEGDDFRNRRRNRRNRFRADGDGPPRPESEGGEYRGEDRAPREDRPPREDRAPREDRRPPREDVVARDDERPRDDRPRDERPQRDDRPPREPRRQRDAEAPEGFADSPKPAFLAGE